MDVVQTPLKLRYLGWVVSSTVEAHKMDWNSNPIVICRPTGLAGVEPKNHEWNVRWGRSVGRAAL